jgi:hypothetical protein
MTDKKPKNMSIAIEPEMKTLLSVSAKKLGCSVSELIRTLVNKHLDLVVNDEEMIPVILKVPSNLKGNTQELQGWFDARVNMIVKKLGEAS